MSELISKSDQKVGQDSFRPPISILPDECFNGFCYEKLNEFYEEACIQYQIKQQYRPLLTAEFQIYDLTLNLPPRQKSIIDSIREEVHEDQNIIIPKFCQEITNTIIDRVGLHEEEKVPNHVHVLKSYDAISEDLCSIQPVLELEY